MATLVETKDGDDGDSGESGGRINEHLSSTYRPSCIYDSNNQNNVLEKKLMSELIRVADSKNVQIVVEGFGFSSLDKLRQNVEIQKQYCSDTPFNTSIPSVVDIALPYINISRTIGSSVAGYLGASLLCYDIFQRDILDHDAVCRRDAVAFNISAHAVNLARGYMDTALRNNASHRAFKEMRIDDICNLSIDPEETRRFLEKRLNNPLVVGKATLI